MHENLQKLIDRRGISVSELARQLGFKSDTTLGRWLKDESEPRVSEAIKIAKFFGVGILELLGDDSSSTKGPKTDPPLDDEDKAILRYVHAMDLTFEKIVKIVKAHGSASELSEETQDHREKKKG